MILILHGWGQHKSFWTNFVNKLSKIEKTQAIDLPGFGKEKLVFRDWGIPEYADWVENTIKDQKSVILIGHSFGGRIAAEVASRQPKNITGLVLTGAPCLYRPTKSTQTKIGFYKSVKSFLPKNIKTKFYSDELTDSQKQGLEQIFRKVVVYDQTQQLKKIVLPTLLVWGEKDLDVPIRIASEMHSLIKISELKVIEDAGHNVFLEKPDLFYGYVKNYISNL